MCKLHVTKQHINKFIPLKSPNKGEEYREHELLFPNELFRGSKEIRVFFVVVVFFLGREVQS